MVCVCGVNLACCEQELISKPPPAFKPGIQGLVAEGAFDVADTQTAQRAAAGQPPKTYPVRSVDATILVDFFELGEWVPLGGSEDPDASSSEQQALRARLRVTHGAGTRPVTRMRIKSLAEKDSEPGPLQLQEFSIVFAEASG